MLEKEFSYYQTYKEEFLEKYEGKFIVIIGHEVVGVYDSYSDALLDSQGQYEMGTFLIQHCSNNKGTDNQMFYSTSEIGNVKFI